MIIRLISAIDSSLLTNGMPSGAIAGAMAGIIGYALFVIMSSALSLISLIKLFKEGSFVSSMVFSSFSILSNASVAIFVSMNHQLGSELITGISILFIVGNVALMLFHSMKRYGI